MRTSLLSHRLSIQQIERLLEELPSYTQVRGKLRRNLPVILEVHGNVIFFERNERISLRENYCAGTLKEAAETVSTASAEVQDAVRCGQKSIGGVLIVELSAKCDGMAAEAPGRIVLNLTGLDDTPLRKVASETVACKIAAQRDLRGAGCKIGDRAVWEVSALKSKGALLEAIAKLIDPM